jgi:hypothetical protein
MARPYSDKFWFRGRPIRKNHKILIGKAIVLIELDLVKGVLPARNLSDARRYVRDWSLK